MNVGLIISGLMVLVLEITVWVMVWKLNNYNTCSLYSPKSLSLELLSATKRTDVAVKKDLAKMEEITEYEQMYEAVFNDGEFEWFCAADDDEAYDEAISIMKDCNYFVLYHVHAIDDNYKKIRTVY